MTAPSPQRRARADLALASICLLWGSTFVVVQNALAEASTLLFLALRFSLATVALLVMFAFGRGLGTVLRGGPAIGGVLAGCCLFGGYFLQTEGLKYTTPGKSGFITGLYIVLVPVFAAIIHRRMPKRLELAGVAIAGAGLVVMSVPTDSFRMNLGDLLTIGCAALYAAHIIVLGRFSPTMTVERLTLLQIGTCAALALATFRWAEPVYFRPTATLWIAVVATGLLATALAFTLQTWAQQFTTPTRTALIFSLEPVFALATSYAVGAEPVSARSLAGAALILAAVIVVELPGSGSKG